MIALQRADGTLLGHIAHGHGAPDVGGFMLERFINTYPLVETFMTLYGCERYENRSDLLRRGWSNGADWFYIFDSKWLIHSGEGFVPLDQYLENWRG